MAEEHPAGRDVEEPDGGDASWPPVPPSLTGVDPSSPLPSPGPDQSSGGAAEPVVRPVGEATEADRTGPGASHPQTGSVEPVLPGVDPSSPSPSPGPDQSSGGSAAPVVAPAGGLDDAAVDPEPVIPVVPVLPGVDPSRPVAFGPDQSGDAPPPVPPVGGPDGAHAAPGVIEPATDASEPVLPGVDPSSPLPSPGPDQSSGGAAAPVVRPVGDDVGEAGSRPTDAQPEPVVPVLPVLPGVDPSLPPSFGPDQSGLPPFDSTSIGAIAAPSPTTPAPTIPAPAAPVVPAPPRTGAVGDDAGTAPPAELSTRNVPHTPHRTVDLGLPVAPTSPSTQPAFVRPVLLSMGPPTTALLVGRALMVLAALLVGITARRSAGAGGAQRGEAFWPVVGSAAVFVVVAVAGLVYWSVSLADNARRLSTRCASPSAIGWAWAIPVGWAALSALTYLRVEIDDQLDPLPGVAGVGLAVTLAIPYARLQGVFRGLTRRPPVLWLSAFPLDLVAFGLLWWRLTSWPDPVTGSDWDHVRLTANLAFGAAALLAVNGLVYGWLATRASASVYERLGRLETRHRHEDDARPEWFAVGLQVRADAAPVDARPLINTLPLTGIVALFHVLWGVSTVAASIVLARLAFEYSDESSILGELVLTDEDADRVALVASVVALVYVATIVVHGVWSVLVALNARRVTVHVPNPWSFGIVFMPMPVLVVAGLLIGGDVGYWVVVIGLAFAFFGLLRVNQMLMNLSSRLGGGLSGFSRWTFAIALVYLVGLAENFLFSRATARLGFLATATLVQGVLMAVGGVIGFRAMRSLEDTLRQHRQRRRAEPLVATS